LTAHQIKIPQLTCTKVVETQWLRKHRTIGFIRRMKVLTFSAPLGNARYGLVAQCYKSVM
jgi:hypothetical protein